MNGVGRMSHVPDQMRSGLNGGQITAKATDSTGKLEKLREQKDAPDVSRKASSTATLRRRADNKGDQNMGVRLRE